VGIMSDPEKPSHWDFLAEDLGARTPPEPAPEPEAADGDEADSTPAVKRRSEPRKPPKPPANHWQSVASEFGLEVAEQPDTPEQPEAPEQPETPEQPEHAAQPEAPQQAEPVDMDTAGGPDELTAEPVAGEAEEAAAWPGPALSESESQSADEPPATPEELSPRELAQRAATLEFGFGVIDAEDTRDQSFIEEAEDAVADESEGQSDADSDEVAETAGEADEDFAGDAAAGRVSLEEEFETAEERTSEAAETEKKKPRRRRRGGRRRRKPETGEDGRADEAEPSEHAAVAEVDVAGDEQDDLSAGPAKASSEEAPREREGRRRAKRRRPSKDAAAAADQPDAAQDDEAAVAGGSGETVASEERRSQDRRDRGESGDESAEEESGRPSHRKIPSWSEAVDLLVSRNMKARSRSSEGKGRRRGRGGKGRRPGRGKKP
jgi:ribonuclease E